MYKERSQTNRFFGFRNLCLAIFSSLLVLSSSIVTVLTLFLAVQQQKAIAQDTFRAADGNTSLSNGDVSQSITDTSSPICDPGPDPIPCDNPAIDKGTSSPIPPLCPPGSSPSPSFPCVPNISSYNNQGQLVQQPRNSGIIGNQGQSRQQPDPSLKAIAQEQNSTTNDLTPQQQEFCSMMSIVPENNTGTAEQKSNCLSTIARMVGQNQLKANQLSSTPNQTAISSTPSDNTTPSEEQPSTPEDYASISNQTLPMTQQTRDTLSSIIARMVGQNQLKANQLSSTPNQTAISSTPSDNTTPSEEQPSTPEGNTYQSPQLGISIQNPGNWEKLESLSSGSTTPRSVTFYEPKVNGALYLGRVIVGFLPSNNMPLDQYFNQAINDLKANSDYKDLQILETNQVTVNGNPAYMVHYTFNKLLIDTEAMNVYTLSPNGDKVFRFAYFAEPSQYRSNFPIVSDMLNSLQTSEPTLPNAVSSTDTNRLINRCGYIASENIIIPC